MIDLAAAYTRFDELLSKYGLTCSYAITIIVFNRRHNGASVTFTLSALIGTGQCETAYDRTTLDDAFAVMDARLAEITRPKSPPVVLDDVREVVLPGMGDGGEAARG